MRTRLDVERIREQLPATRAAAYLNTGTAGPLPLECASTLAQAAAEELERGRIGRAGFERFFEQVAALRARLARVVGAGEDEIALTHNTTEGMNIGVWGTAWRPGDHVVTTTLEHPGALLPLYVLHRRHHVQVTFADIGQGAPDETLAALERALRPGVRMLVLSHVAYGTGATLPLREITERAHEAGAVVLVDGAQSAGALPVDVHQLGVDYYAFPGQKWLLGPEGTGGLFVRRDRLDELAPTYVGGFAVDHAAYRPNDVEAFAPAAGAARYEGPSSYRPALAGLDAAVRWLDGTVGLDDAYRAIAELAAYARERVAELPGATVLTPPDAMSGLIAFTLAGVDSPGCVTYLADRDVMIRSIPDNGALRVSCGFFNTPDEIDRMIELIHEYAGGR